MQPIGLNVLRWHELEGSWQALVRDGFHPAYLGIGEAYAGVEEVEAKIASMSAYPGDLTACTAWSGDHLVGFLVGRAAKDRLVIYDLFVATAFRRRRSLLYVAEDADGQIIRFASGGPERTGDQVYTGEVYALYLLEGWQRRGIGRGLTVTLVTQLLHAGLTSLLIWGLAQNGSRRFYEALGGQLVREKMVTIGGAQLLEVAYGWLETRRIIETQHSGPGLPSKP
jgi:GNAT superfamily N-acetyltransferase